MINKDDFYLQDIELLKQLQPIMAKKGIEADRFINCYYLKDRDIPYLKIYFNEETKLSDNEGLVGHKGEYYGILYASREEIIPTWIKPSLEAALPEWYSRVIRIWAIDQDYLFVGALCKAIPDFKDRRGAKLLREGIKEMFEKIIILDGQESLKALAQLNILLDKELGGNCTCPDCLQKIRGGNCLCTGLDKEGVE